jgi:hypothetical protein
VHQDDLTKLLQPKRTFGALGWSARDAPLPEAQGTTIEPVQVAQLRDGLRERGIPSAHSQISDAAAP